MTAVARNYAYTRVRGLAPWRSQAKTQMLLDQVIQILDKYAAHLPLTSRQIFYRLVGACGYPKDEAAYVRLLDKLGRARRAELIPFDSIRDDGITESLAGGFHGKPDFLAWVRAVAGSYGRDRSTDPEIAIEIWVEASGMVPQIARVAHPHGADVYSCGGFDSLTARRRSARSTAR